MMNTHGNGGREIVTLQLGQEANSCGAHLWNLQLADTQQKANREGDEEPVFDVSVMHRLTEPVGNFASSHLPSEQTIYPRLLALDWDVNFLATKQTSSDDPQTTDDIESVKIARLNELQELRESLHLTQVTDTNVAVIDRSALTYHQTSHKYNNSELQSGQPDPFSLTRFSDVMRQRLHQKSICKLDSFAKKLRTLHHAHRAIPSDVQSLRASKTTTEQAVEADQYSNGLELVNEQSSVFNEFVDRFRFFLEECDNLQGVQLLVDDDSCFGGIATKVVEEIIDNHTKRPIAAYGLSFSEPNQVPQEERSQRQQVYDISRSLTLLSLHQLCALYLPLDLSAPSLRNMEAGFNAGPHFCAASSLETLLSPLKVTQNQISIHELLNHLKGFDARRNIFTAECSLGVDGSAAVVWQKLYQDSGETLFSLGFEPASLEHTEVNKSGVFYRSSNTASLLQRQQLSESELRTTDVYSIEQPLEIRKDYVMADRASNLSDVSRPLELQAIVKLFRSQEATGKRLVRSFLTLKDKPEQLMLKQVQGGKDELLEVLEEHYSLLEVYNLRLCDEN